MDDFIFFGTPELAVTILEELAEVGLMPTMVVTAPDRKQGRGMQLTPPPVKVWADAHNIPSLQPTDITDANFLNALRENTATVFVLAAYGKILPQELIDIPQHGIVNVHPSLLPLHRGPSPIEAQILSDDQTVGVSVMLIDEKMDHGPLLAQTEMYIDDADWPLTGSKLESILAHEGGKLLAHVLPLWVSGETKAIEQDHDIATFCRLIKKENGLIDITNDDPREIFLKVHAYDRWPRAYFFDTNNKRVVITEAQYIDGALVIQKVIPEGKKETAYESYVNNLN